MEKKSSSTPFASEQTEGAREANRQYQAALAKLTQSLDQRKNRFFDPVWLAASQGFATPGVTDFFGSLGHVASNVNKAQEGLIKEDQAIAQQQLELAGRGVELERQKSKDAMIRRFLAGEEEPTRPAGALPTSSRAEAGEPSGARPAQGALAQAQGAPGREMGIPLLPGTPGISRQQFFALGIAEGKNTSDLAKEWEAIQRGRLQSRENYMVDTGTGMAYLVPSAKPVDVQIFNRDGSPPRTFKVTESQAIRLTQLAEQNDAEGYFAFAERIIRGPQAQSAQQAAPSAPVLAPAAPTVSAPPQPVAVSQSAPSAGAQAAPAAVMPPAAAARVPTPQGGAQAAQGLPAAATSAAAARVPTPQAAAALPQAAPPVVPQAAPSAAARPATAVVPPANVPSTQAAAVPAAVPSAVAQAAPVAPGRVAAAGAAPSVGLRSKEDIEAEQRRILLEQKRAEALQTAEVESEIKNRSEITDAAKKAREITATANILRRFSDNPNFSKMTGILNNEKISSGLAMLVRDGVGGRSISIGLPAIEDVMRNARLTPAEQAQYRTFLMYTAQMNLAAENSMKGSTTERERLILGNATISNQDTRETVRTKADLLNLKAQFDKRVANAFEDSKMTPKEFFRSDRFNTMYSSYLENLEEVAIGAKMLPTRAGAQTGAQRQGAPAQGGTTGNAAAGNRLRELLNRPPQRRP